MEQGCRKSTGIDNPALITVTPIPQTVHGQPNSCPKPAKDPPIHSMAFDIQTARGPESVNSLALEPSFAEEHFLGTVFLDSATKIINHSLDNPAFRYAFGAQVFQSAAVFFRLLI